MRVVMVLGRSTGGIGTHVVDLVSRLRQLGDEVEVVTDPLTADRFGIGDARLWWPGRGAGPVGSLRGVLALRRLSRSADVVHAHGHQAGIVAAAALVGVPTPLVVSQHNAVLDDTGLRALLSAAVQRFVAHRADLVAGASSDLVTAAEDHGARTAALAPVPSPRVPDLLRQDPADPEERGAAATRLLEHAGLGRTGPLVLTISRIAPQKDLGTLVEVAARLHSPVTWVVVGDGDAELLAAVREHARLRNVPVHFVGAVDDPGPWLRAAECFVLPSRWEARALVVQEAMAAGLPVVASDVGGLHDLVHGTGRLVPVGDVDGFAAALDAILGDPDGRAAISDAGRERARSWEDSESAARRWQHWYAGLPSMT